MIINFTPKEEEKIKSIEDSYDRLIEVQQQLIERLRPGDNGPDEALYNAIQNKRPKHPEPAGYTEDGQPYYTKEDLEPYQKANEAVNREIEELFDAWEAAGEPAWRKAREKLRTLIDQKGEAIRSYIAECELRQFAELGNDPDAIYQDALYQARENLERRYAYYQEQHEKTTFSAYDVRATDDGFILDTEAVIESFRDILHLHIDFMQEVDKTRLTIMCNEVELIIDESPYTSRDIGKKGATVPRRETTGKSYRRRAASNATIDTMPKALIQPTLSGYQYGLSLYNGGNAYLQPLSSTDNLRFEDGKLFFKGRLEEVSAAELQNIKTKEGRADLDLPLLKSFYSIILTDFEQNKKVNKAIEIYVPDLAACLGMRKNLGAEEIKTLLKKTQSFQTIMGVLKEPRNGKMRESYYAVLLFEYYDEKRNVISFSSPYMNYLIKTILDKSVRKDRQGKTKLKKDGKTPLTVAQHSYLVKTSIASEKNKAAVENVFIIVTGLEQAGGKSYHIAVSTLIERNPQLQQRLAESANATQLLKRIFTKTWELLRKQTYLENKYKDIKLPDPKDPSVIPTAKSVNSLVIEITHSGKRPE